MKNKYDIGEFRKWSLLDEFPMWKEENPIERSITMMYMQMERKRNDLVKQKLIEKGFGYLVAGLEKRRFPKVCCIIQNGWSFYYADDDTDEGCFIIAIEEIIAEKGMSRNPTITVSFRYQNTYNGEIKML